MSEAGSDREGIMAKKYRVAAYFEGYVAEDIGMENTMCVAQQLLAELRGYGFNRIKIKSPRIMFLCRGTYQPGKGYIHS